MKQFNVISPVYKNQAVNFNGFVVNFDANGKGILKFEENQTEKAEKVFLIHPNIYKGDKLPKKEVKTATQENNNSAVTTEIEILKDSNKKLALENAELKKENEALKKENEVLKKVADNNEEENPPKDENIQNEENSLKDDLNKKTINELKELLDTEDFLPFKEEWKGLTKKEDIVNFILTKIEEN